MKRVLIAVWKKGLAAAQSAGGKIRWDPDLLLLQETWDQRPLVSESPTRKFNDVGIVPYAAYQRSNWLAADVESVVLFTEETICIGITSTATTLTLWTPEAGIPGRQSLSISPETGILLSRPLTYSR